MVLTMLKKTSYHEDDLCFLKQPKHILVTHLEDKVKHVYHDVI